MNNSGSPASPLQNTVQILTPISHTQAWDGTCPAAASVERYLGVILTAATAAALCAAE